MADQLLAGLPPVLDFNGDVVAGGSVTFYETGTTTPVAIFSDVAATIPLTNPLTLDSAGRPSSQIFYVGTVAVKEVIKDAGGATLYTVDPSPRFSITAAAASGVTYSPIANNPTTNVQAAIDYVSNLSVSTIPALAGSAGKALFVDGAATAFEFASVGGIYCTATGSDAIALTTGLSLSGKSAGDQLYWMQAATNVGAVTIAVDGGLTAPLVLNNGSAVPAGKLILGDFHAASYDGTNWVLNDSTGLDGTVIGGKSPAAGSFTTLGATGLTTLSSVDINGGNIDGTPIGATTPAAGDFTTVNATSSTLVGSLSSSRMFTGPGTISAPAWSFTADTNTGLYSPVADRIDVVSAASSVGFFSGTGLNSCVIGATTPAAADFTDVGFTGVANAANGTATATAYGFTGQPATGMYRESATGYLNFSVGGTEQLSLEPTFARFGGTVQTPAGVIAGTTMRTGDGTAAAPGFTFAGDTDIGMFTSGTNTLNFATSGISRISIGAGGATTIDNLACPQANIDGGNIDGTVIGGSSASTANFEAASASCLTLNRETTTGIIQRFAYNNTQVGNITVTASTTAYSTSSDYRLKESITPIQGASDIVKAMRPATYTFKSDGSWADGFIAHELQELHPVAVTGVKDGMKDEEYEVTPAVEATYDAEGIELTSAEPAVMGTRSVPDYQGVDYSKLTPILTAALQEALTKIDALTARIDALEAKP